MAEGVANSDDSKETQTRVSDKVLFVRNLPYRINDDEFEKAFSEIGPLKRAFVAREKGNITRTFWCARG